MSSFATPTTFSTSMMHASSSSGSSSLVTPDRPLEGKIREVVTPPCDNNNNNSEAALPSTPSAEKLLENCLFCIQWLTHVAVHGPKDSGSNNDDDEERNTDEAPSTPSPSHTHHNTTEAFATAAAGLPALTALHNAIVQLHHTTHLAWTEADDALAEARWARTVATRHAQRSTHLTRTATRYRTEREEARRECVLWQHTLQRVQTKLVRDRRVRDRRAVTERYVVAALVAHERQLWSHSNQQQQIQQPQQETIVSTGSPPADGCDGGTSATVATAATAAASCSTGSAGVSTIASSSLHAMVHSTPTATTVNSTVDPSSQEGKGIVQASPTDAAVPVACCLERTSATTPRGQEALPVLVDSDEYEHCRLGDEKDHDDDDDGNDITAGTTRPSTDGSQRLDKRTNHGNAATTNGGRISTAQTSSTPPTMTTTTTNLRSAAVTGLTEAMATTFGFSFGRATTQQQRQPEPPAPQTAQMPSPDQAEAVPSVSSSGLDQACERDQDEQPVLVPRPCVAPPPRQNAAPSPSSVSQPYTPLILSPSFGSITSHNSSGKLNGKATTHANGHAGKTSFRRQHRGGANAQPKIPLLQLHDDNDDDCDTASAQLHEDSNHTDTRLRLRPHTPPVSWTHAESSALTGDMVDTEGATKSSSSKAATAATTTVPDQWVKSSCPLTILNSMPSPVPTDDTEWDGSQGDEEDPHEVTVMVNDTDHPFDGNSNNTTTPRVRTMDVENYNAWWNNAMQMKCDTDNMDDSEEKGVHDCVRMLAVHQSLTVSDGDETLKLPSIELPS